MRIAPQWANRLLVSDARPVEDIQRTLLGFRPDRLDNLVGWYDAHSLDLADGNAVSTWPDLSPASNDVAQGTAGAQPTFKTGIVNGLPVVRFDGGDLLSSSAIGVSGYPFTVYYVAQTHSDTGTHAIWSIIDSSTSDTYWAVWGEDRGAGVATPTIVRRDTNFFAVDGSTDMSNSFVVVCNRYASSSLMELYTNGSFVGSDSNSVSFSANLDDLSLGAMNRDSGAVTQLDGDIAEVVVYDDDHDDGERDLVFNYLNGKYEVF